MRKLSHLAACLAAAAIGLGFSLAAGAAGAQSWDEIVKAAEREGAVAVITPPVAAHRESVAEFQKAYPRIELHATAIPSSAFEPRIDSERKAGIYTYDVMIGGLSLSMYSKAIPEGWYLPVTELVRPDIRDDSLWLGGFDAGFMDKQRKYAFAFAANTSNNFLIDRDKIPVSELGSYDDLLKPEWKGRIAFYDPRIRGPGSFTFAQLYIVMGPEKAGRLLRQQDVVLTKDVRQGVEWSVRGRYPIVLGVPSSSLRTYQQKGLGTQVKLLDAPERMTVVTQAWGGLGMFSKAPHPNAARVFLNWLLSKEAQTDWAKRALVNSRRKDVPKGDPQSAVSESLYRNGISLAKEETQEVRRKAIALAREALKR